MEFVMLERISELFGFFLGYPLGLFLAAGSILRHSRIFHPRGLAFCGEIETYPESPLNFPPHALIRFSSAWWKFREWPDALGIAIRMSQAPVRSSAPARGDSDLLFASFRKPWEIFLSPFITDHTDFLANNYFAISPFHVNEKLKAEFMIDPSRGHRAGGTREEKLLGNVISGKVILRLLMRVHGQKSWKLIARIIVRDELQIDQEALRFHPFRCGLPLRPAGFLQHLRFGPYKMSQWVRPGASTEQVEDHSRENA